MLTKSFVDRVTPQSKPRRFSDGRGMYLEVSPAGGRWWRLKYRLSGRERRMSLGVYPDVTLAKARERREVARQLIADGIDPVEQRRAHKATILENTVNTFKATGLEWHGLVSPRWTPEHSRRILRGLEADIFPWLGARPVRTISAQELLVVLRRIEARGANSIAARALRICGRIFRFAVATGRADRDPSRDLLGALAPNKTRHFASLSEPAAVGDLMRAIDAYHGAFITRCALRLAPLVFVRPGELRKAEWSEFDLPKSQWRIPAKRMKMRQQHLVPLARQAVAILQELKAVTGRFSFAFPSVRSRFRPMSENTLTAALRRMGYSSEQMTAHGFRSMASTVLNEQRWSADCIERQLAHGERNSVRAAYNYAQLLPERIRMMQAWADTLDELKGRSDSPSSAQQR